MIAFLVVVAVVWLALMPPLFTDGKCTAEFEAASKRLETERKAIASPERAASYWRESHVRHAVMSPEECRRRKPRMLERCGDGALVIAWVPVRNTICSLYRDDTVRVYLQYDKYDRLARMQLEMSPYKSLPLPFLGTTLHWGR